MKMVWLYRVESENGVGPYGEGSGAAHRSAAEKLNLPRFNNGEPENRPRPTDDGLPYPYETDRFAFREMFQFFDWFPTPEDILLLRVAGYKLYRIWVPQKTVEYGGRQCMYPDAAVVAKGEIPWTDVHRAFVANSARKELAYA